MTSTLIDLPISPVNCNPFTLENPKSSFNSIIHIYILINLVTNCRSSFIGLFLTFGAIHVYRRSVANMSKNSNQLCFSGCGKIM